ncbi:unnamed protein product [Rotaria sp. Silwood1]|nr:unnamed protein product [Rotaria sp. Silwood1]
MSIYMNKYIWSYWNKFQKSVSNFVAEKYFHRIVLSAIVINTLSMGIEYHEQPQSLTNALEYCNLERQFLNLTNIIFTIEMLTKVIVSEFIFGLHTYLLISRVCGLKLVVQTLLSSLRLIGYIVVICFFFLINMFVGVVVENFHKCRAE